jgi:glycosyltransferase involved in cell wall biosynthesis
MVLLEALASGLPCVTTDTGGQAEVVADRVGAVTGVDPDALADGLARIVESYPRYQRATEGYVAHHYAQTDVVRQYERVFHEVGGQPITPARTTGD